MKNANGKTEWMRYFAYALSAVTIAIAASACGKKDGGGGGGAVAVVPGYGASCVGCTATMTGLVASGNARSMGYVNGAWVEQAELSLNFYGEAAGVTGTGGGYYGGYRGAVAASGVMRVRVAKAPTAPVGYPGGYPATGCNVPAGDYQITTLTPGVWSGQSFQNLQVQAAGPVVLRLDLRVGMIQAATPALVDWGGQTFPYFVKTQAWVTPISGGGYCNAGNIPEYYFED